MTLNSRFDAMIQERIEHGDCADAADAVDVVEDALRLLEEHDRLKLERLHAALQIGLDQLDRGEGREFTPDVSAEILANARRKVREGHRPDPDVCP